MKIYEEYGLSNTGIYTSKDIIFVASNGNRKGSVIPCINGVLQKEYTNMYKAMSADSKFILDTEEHLSRTKQYNTGELLLAEFLESNNYIRVGDSGLWEKGNSQCLRYDELF